MGDNNNSLADEKLSIILIGVGSAAFVMTIYHCLVIGRCNRHGHVPDQRRHVVTFDVEAAPVSIENSTAQLIPSHKYQKGKGLMGGEEDDDNGGTCAVCLGEFEEGDELRTLPECLHSYHAPCIDMWLYSHTNCPMCRTDATPSPQIFRPPGGLAGSEDMEAGMLRNVDVQ